MPFTDTIKPGGQTGAGVVNLIVANLIMAIVVAATCLAAAAASATTPDNTEPATPGDDAAFFNDRVLPIFRERCFDCHSHDGEIKRFHNRLSIITK